MLKFIFWTLLLANAALAAYQFGYLDDLLPDGREPTRMDMQLNPERLRVVPAPPPPPQPQPESPASATVPAIGAATALASVSACVEIGNFNSDEARLFLAQLGELGTRARQHTVQEVVSHMVYMPPQAGREAAEKKAAELRRLGIDDFYIIQDNSSLQWGISLGVFKTEESARVHLARLNQKGVRSARTGRRSVTSSQLAFQFRDLDASAMNTLERAKSGFSRQELRECAEV